MESMTGSSLDWIAIAGGYLRARAAEEVGYALLFAAVQPVSQGIDDDERGLRLDDGQGMVGVQQTFGGVHAGSVP